MPGERARLVPVRLWEPPQDPARDPWEAVVRRPPARAPVGFCALRDDTTVEAARCGTFARRCTVELLLFPLAALSDASASSVAWDLRAARITNRTGTKKSTSSTHSRRAFTLPDRPTHGVARACAVPVGRTPPQVHSHMPHWYTSSRDRNAMRGRESAFF